MTAISTVPRSSGAVAAVPAATMLQYSESPGLQTFALTEAGVIKSTKAFRSAVEDAGARDKLQYGRFALDQEGVAHRQSISGQLINHSSKGASVKCYN